MDSAEEDVLAYMSFAPQHRTKLHSTNPLERVNGEFKRRTEVLGIFPNEEGITRLVGAILLEQNDEWAVQRSRYMTLESFPDLGDIPATISTRAISEAVGAPLATLAPTCITLPRDTHLACTGQVVRFIQSNGSAVTASGPDPALARLIQLGRKCWAVLREGHMGPRQLAAKEGVNPSCVSRVARLAFLAPEVVEAALAGRLRPDITSSALLRHDAIPGDWDEQVRLFVAA